MARQALRAVDDAPQLSEARTNLAAQIEALQRAQESLDDLQAQRRRLEGIVQSETDAKAWLDQVRADEAKAMADAVAANRMLPAQDSDALADAEHDLRIRTRDADAARAVMARIGPELTLATQSVHALKRSIRPLVARVLVEESVGVRAELDLLVEALRAKAASLCGLRRFLADFEEVEVKRLFTGVPEAVAEAYPGNRDVNDAADEWGILFEALARDPAAKMQEQAQ